MFPQPGTDCPEDRTPNLGPNWEQGHSSPRCPLSNPKALESGVCIIWATTTEESLDPVYYCIQKQGPILQTPPKLSVEGKGTPTSDFGVWDSGSSRALESEASCCDSSATTSLGAYTKTRPSMGLIAYSHTKKGQQGPLEPSHAHSGP